MHVGWLGWQEIVWVEVMGDGGWGMGWEIGVMI